MTNAKLRLLEFVIEPVEYIIHLLYRAISYTGALTSHAPVHTLLIVSVIMTMVGSGNKVKS